MTKLNKLIMPILLFFMFIPVIIFPETGIAHGPEETSTNSAISFSLEEIFVITLVLAFLLLLALLKISKINDTQLLMKMFGIALIFLTIDYFLFKFEIL